MDSFAEWLDANAKDLHYHLELPGVRKERKLEFVKVTERGGSHIIFFDKEFVSKNSDSKNWFIDATFSVRPKKGGYQFMTIMMEKDGKVNYILYKTYIP